MSKGKASSNITYEDENEDLVDEINKFHADDRKLAKDAIYRKKKFDRPEELLSVEAEASESSEDEDGSDFDDDDSDVNDITDNKWGKKRKDFYGTGFVDEDFGGMREEEEQDAELEEEDALNRQKQLDKSTAAIADLFDDSDEEEKEEETVEIDTALEFNETNAKRKNKKTVKLLREFEARSQLFKLVVQPLGDVIEKMPKCALRTQLTYVVQTYASYLMNASFQLKLRAKQFENERLEDPLIEIHPVQEALVKLGKRITECETFLTNNYEQLSELKKWANEEPEKIDELCQKIGGIKFSKKNGAVVSKTPVAAENGEKLAYTPMDLESDEKRKANEKIAKNREYQERRGKKKAKTSKTKNRRKVHAIEKRVKSQVGNVRREMEKYSGERTGIRASTIKSTKLIA